MCIGVLPHPIAFHTHKQVNPYNKKRTGFVTLRHKLSHKPI